MQQPPAQKPLEILVVDDAPANLVLLINHLKTHGYEVRPVTRGAQAIAAARKRPPDLVLLDVNMPDMTGYEVCIDLKADPALAKVPVIFVSALSEAFDKVKAFSVGGVDYITKPFHLDEVRSRVETHLALRRREIELATAYEQLRVLEDARAMVARAIVHDLKSPLAAVQGCAQLALLVPEVQGDLRETLEEIVAAAATAARIVLNLLDVGRLEDAALVSRREDVELRDLVASAHATGDLLTRLSGHRLAVDANADEVVYVDPDLVSRILENLIDNAAKYAPPNTVIRVVLRGDGAGGCLIRVEDAGMGVPPEQREAIFEPRVRQPEHLKVHARASRGLGLAFCKKAVEGHGGRIWVEDAQPRGAAFCAFIPGLELALPDATPARPAPEATIRGVGPRSLIDAPGATYSGGPWMPVTQAASPSPPREGGTDARAASDPRASAEAPTSPEKPARS